MDKDDYIKIVKKFTKNEDRLKNALLAFVSGGLIGVISGVIYLILINNNISDKDALSWVILILIFISSLCTGLGFFDKLVEKFRCGIIVPITGFAHSLTSSTMDYKHDGLITGIGGNAFRLAGSVILYGVVTSFILVIIKVIFNG